MNNSSERNFLLSCEFLNRISRVWNVAKRLLHVKDRRHIWPESPWHCWDPTVGRRCWEQHSLRLTSHCCLCSVCAWPPVSTRAPLAPGEPSNAAAAAAAAAARWRTSTVLNSTLWILLWLDSQYDLCLLNTVIMDWFCLWVMSWHPRLAHARLWAVLCHKWAELFSSIICAWVSLRYTRDIFPVLLGSASRHTTLPSTGLQQTAFNYVVSSHSVVLW